MVEIISVKLSFILVASRKFESLISLNFILYNRVIGNVKKAKIIKNKFEQTICLIESSMPCLYSLTTKERANKAINKIMYL
jgi:hypothetical protein